MTLVGLPAADHLIIPIYTDWPARRFLSMSHEPSRLAAKEAIDGFVQFFERLITLDGGL
jgi:hypothetical protein